MDFIIVDGYNVVNAWRNDFQDCTDLEHQRLRLLEMLSDYQGARGCTLYVVFDAHLVKDATEVIEKYDGLTVVFTRENETADAWIERFVYRAPEDWRMWVVTSDYMEQRTVLLGGGARLSPREFREMVRENRKGRADKSRMEPIQTNRIMDNIPEHLRKAFEKMRRGDM